MSPRTSLWRPRDAALLLVAVVAAQCAAPPPTPREPPKIVFDAVTWDFGPVEQGKPLAHAFALHNSGGSDLAIDNVKSACDCTALVLPGGAVAPGGSASLHVKCDTARAFGPRALTATLYSSDPAQPTTTVTLAALVTADVAADPPDLYVGRVRRGEHLDVPLRIVTGPGRPPVGMRVPKPDGPILHASLPGPTPGQTERSVNLSIQGNASLGAFTEAVVIDTSSARYPKVTARVTGVVDGDVTAAPREVRFGAVTAGSGATRLVVLRNQGEVPARVIGATLSQPIARAQIETVQGGREYRVLVTLSGMLPPGRVQAQLKIETDRPEQPALTIPVSATIREKK